jgi:integrase
MVDIYDRWHLSRPKAGDTPCREHKGKYRSSEHGVGKRWQLRYRDANGKQIKENFEKLTDAEDRQKIVGAELLKGSYIDPKAGKVTLRSYVEKSWWETQVHLRPGTRETYERHLQKHILPNLGNRSLGAMKRPAMKSFVAGISKVLAPSTVHTVFAVLRRIMQSAVDDELIASNPCSRVPLPEISPRVLKPLSPQAVVAPANAVPTRYRVTVWLAAGAGLREGEALGLTVPRINIDERKIHVEEQMQRKLLSPLKTKASRRTIPVDDLVIREIKAHMGRYREGEHHLLVTNRCSRPVQRGSFNDCWRKAVKDAGLPKGTRFHDLRHFYASVLISHGLHPKTVQARLGHATMAETMDTYGHLFPDADDHGRGALDTVFDGGDE